MQLHSANWYHYILKFIKFVKFILFYKIYIQRTYNKHNKLSQTYFGEFTLPDFKAKYKTIVI
jgi:hypothetical protein